MRLFCACLNSSFPTSTRKCVRVSVSCASEGFVQRVGVAAAKEVRSVGEEGERAVAVAVAVSATLQELLLKGLTKVAKKEWINYFGRPHRIEKSSFSTTHGFFLQAAASLSKPTTLWLPRTLIFFSRKFGCCLLPLNLLLQPERTKAACLKREGEKKRAVYTDIHLKSGERRRGKKKGADFLEEGLEEEEEKEEKAA